MTQTERRKENRSLLDIDLTLASGGKEDQGTAKDISISGIRVQSSMGVAPGDEVIVTLRGPEEMVLMGRVIWSLYQVENLIDWYQMGIESEVLVFRNERAVGLAKRSEMIETFLALLDPGEGTADSPPNPSEP